MHIEFLPAHQSGIHEAAGLARAAETITHPISLFESG